MRLKTSSAETPAGAASSQWCLQSYGAQYPPLRPDSDATPGPRALAWDFSTLDPWGSKRNSNNKPNPRTVPINHILVSSNYKKQLAVVPTSQHVCTTRCDWRNSPNLLSSFSQAKTQFHHRNHATSQNKPHYGAVTKLDDDEDTKWPHSKNSWLSLQENRLWMWDRSPWGALSSWM